MSWNGVNVLVTGAGGFIGSHLVETLATEGAHVGAFVRYTSRGDQGNLEFLSSEVRDSLRVIQGDLRDPAAILKAMDGVEVVFHLGALIAIPYSYVNPREVVDVNVMGTLNVLEACRRVSPRRLVHTSTSEVYGTARYVPIDEMHPLQGQSPYSGSKIGADRMVESFARAFDVPAITIRPFNTFGPRQSARAVIPTIVSQALTQDRLRLGSGTPTRDFTFVKDTVRGMMLAGESSLGWTEINLGSGKETSVSDLAARILKLVGRDLPTEQESRRLRPAKSEVDRLCANAAKAAELLGWLPQTSLDDGLRLVIDWVREHPGLYRPTAYQV